MNAQAAHMDSEALLREIARYLAAVDAFRAESCEPTWLLEPGSTCGLSPPGLSRGKQDA